MRLKYYKRSAVIFVIRIDPVAKGHREMNLKVIIKKAVVFPPTAF
jgi:hypothetical protein